MRIAFLAPIKPPDHPIASGDRLIARNLLRAMAGADHEVALASSFIAYSKRPVDVEARKRAALAEAEAAIARLRSEPPDLVATYHPYCKAPDWIGPRIAAAFAVPYVIFEAAKASVTDPAWEPWRSEARREMAGAALHVWLKPTDRDMLQQCFGTRVPLAHLAPFIDVAALDAVEGAAAGGSTPRVLVVGQMRPGKKRRNHEMAAEALHGLVPGTFETLVLGDGPEREAVEALYPAGTRFAGAVAHERVVREMRGADLLLWPGWREPIGMVYLEAAAASLPVAATADMGVPLVVGDGETGLLAPADDVAALGERTARLLTDPALRLRLGAGGRERVVRHHSLDSATKTMQSVLARFAPSGSRTP